MKIPASAAAEVAEQYEQEIVVIAGYDGLMLEVASFGKRPMGKDMAADWADQIPAALGFEFNAAAHRINEDYRATPAARYKRKLDVALAALEEIGNLVPAATSYDGSPVVSLLECWKIQEIARVAVGELRG